jgi:hypothetical protein
MSLNWDARDCDVDLEDEWESTVTHAIVLLTMPIGVRAITGNNWREFYCRTYIWQELNGPLLHKGGENYFITAEDVYRRISLKTNSSPMTKAAFTKGMMGTLYMKANQAIRDFTHGPNYSTYLS